jgi:hypothetical protein
MGYTTDFRGSFQFSRSLTDEELAYLSAFNASRRMRLHVDVLQKEFGTHCNLLVKEGSYGDEGAYFAMELPQGHPAIANYNEPPKGQLSLWCHWKPTKTQLAWDGSEKFHCYIEWLRYLIDHFFIPWKVVLNGAVQWEGEDPDDIGVISVRNNYIHVHYEAVDEEDDDDESEDKDV